MANIQSEILNKYNIDIAQENILKLYKIDSTDISSQDLEQKIQDTRKRWFTSINGANEKNAERDKARLEKADQYETILKNIKLRKEIFEFYNNPTGNNGRESTSGSTEFAKEYFELVATTKKIRKSDVDFFFKYYHSERKNKKVILEMLSKELKIVGLGKEEKYTDEEDSKEGRKKNKANPFIVNLFEEATILKLRRAIDKFDEAAQSKELCERYPDIANGLYTFLSVDDLEDVKQFKDLMSSKGKEVYAVRQERGTEYVPLVDLFNILQSLSECQDVVDNVSEFKLLLKYPSLTPYMFSFVEMKASTVKGLLNIANRNYSFRDDVDFILNYYKPVHDNFGISDSGISSILRNAEKKTKKNKILNKIDKKIGRNTNKKKISFIAEIIHWLLYWPIFATYFVFEVSKAIFTEIGRFTIPVFLLLLGLENWLFPKLDQGIDSLFVLRKLFIKNEWLPYLEECTGRIGGNFIENILISASVIIPLLAIYILPPLFVAILIAEFSHDFNKRFDWVGIERTYEALFNSLRKKTEHDYFFQKDKFIKSRISKALLNLVCLAVLIVIIIFTPIGFRTFSETTGLFQKVDKILETDSQITEENLENEVSIDLTMVITASSANIRIGPSVDYDVIITASEGDVFVSSGNQEAASNGTIWYEIFLSEDKTQLGWASQKVIEFQ